MRRPEAAEPDVSQQVDTARLVFTAAYLGRADDEMAPSTGGQIGSRAAGGSPGSHG